MAGGEQTLVRRRYYTLQHVLLLAVFVMCGAANAQTVYKYRGDDGEWIFSDRRPPDERPVETRAVSPRFERGELTVNHENNGNGLTFTARNSYFVPMELAIDFQRISGVDYPHPDKVLRWLVPARSELVLLQLASLGTLATPSVQYRFVFLPGDPAAVHASSASYRVPYAVGTSYPVTQAFPETITHVTRDSMHAVDLAMPVGTDIVAARGGVVFDVASTNFTGGTDAGQYARLANFVRILHDDGTFAVYAHLNWNTIRVRPGDRVAAGQYIADSGNTGFSSGPHLHFAVLKNMGMRIDSLPIAFRGRSAAPVRPVMGQLLTAYP